MKENVLDILIYLFEHYMLENIDDEPDEEAIMQDLSQAGFHHMTIDRAFDWLENLAEMCEASEQQHWAQNLTAIRVYAAQEAERISLKARGLLISLEHSGVISTVTREMVIDRLMALDAEEIDIEHVKWVILMVMTNCSENPELPVELAESLVLDGAGEHLH